jgi:hypothetical protein
MATSVTPKTRTKAELLRALVAVVGPKYGDQLAAEPVHVLEKLNTLPGKAIVELLNKAAQKARLASLQTGKQPAEFAPASLAGVNVLLWGPPGRGKSQLADVIAKQHAEKVGGIVTQIVCPEDTQVSVLAGAFQPGPGGTWQWVDGPVTKVLRMGGACIMDELAHLSPEASTWLLAAMDLTPTLTLPSGEVITKQPVWFVSTQNDTPSSLLPALADRHPVQLNVTLPFTWAWLGAFAPLAERDLTTSESASLRPWAALRRMTDAGIPLEQSVGLLWPDSPAQLSAIKLGMDE